jgi:putative hydroxymethylpyrimidine transport system ATP-binding protein
MGAVGLHLRIPGLTIGTWPVLGGFELSFAPGQTTVLLGPSGSGKSSLLRLIAGLLPMPSGATLTATDNAPVPPRLAWMAQQDLLLPWLSLIDNVALGARLRGEPPDFSRARKMVEAVGLAGREQARPAELSGGMRQRAALARTLMEDRPFVLMDEPFSAVDAPTRHRLQELSAKLLAGRTVLLVTHDPLEALRLADRILVLSGAPATPQDIEVPAGPTPRPAHDPAVLHAQAALLERLAEAVP